jgi:hypothetical protein
VAPVAQRYSADGRAYPTCHSGHPAAGAGWATAGDIALFARRAARLLEPATVAAMHDAVPVTEHVGFGLGRVVSRGTGPVIHSHGGGMGGISAMMIDIPERELSVAVLANSTNKAARNTILDHVMSRLAPGFHSNQLNPVAEQSRPVRLPHATWTGEVSTAEGNLPLAITILADDQVELRLADEPPATAAASASQRWDLSVAAPLQLPTADARVNSPSFALDLRLDQDRLVGRAIAFKDGDREGWLGAYLIQPCELSSR